MERRERRFVFVLPPRQRCFGWAPTPPNKRCLGRDAYKTSKKNVARDENAKAQERPTETSYCLHDIKLKKVAESKSCATQQYDSFSFSRSDYFKITPIVVRYLEGLILSIIKYLLF